MKLRDITVEHARELLKQLARPMGATIIFREPGDFGRLMATLHGLARGLDDSLTLPDPLAHAVDELAQNTITVGTFVFLSSNVSGSGYATLRAGLRELNRVNIYNGRSKVVQAGNGGFHFFWLWLTWDETRAACELDSDAVAWSLDAAVGLPLPESAEAAIASVVALPFIEPATHAFARSAAESIITSIDNGKLRAIASSAIKAAEGLGYEL